MEVFEQLESRIRGYCRTWPAVFDRAKGARQIDENGKEYIDFFAGAGVLNFGHNDDRMKAALLRYLESDGVTHSLDMATTAKRTFLQTFHDVVLKPRGLDYRMQFTGPTGSNAVEAALKLARKVTGRRTVVAFTNGFHGMTLGSLACTGNAKYRDAAGVPLEHVVRAPFDGYLGEDVDTLEELRRMLADPSSGVAPPAAFVVETIQAEGGVNVARTAWLKGLAELAKAHGALLIVDDIQVGVGRTGSYFSFDGMGIEPDIVCLAKGIGGYGLPLAVCLVKPEHDQWSPGEHTGTFRGQDLAFVAGTVALSYFADDALCDAVKRKGAKTHGRLDALVESLGRPEVDLRGRGMIHGLDLGSGAWATAATKAAFERQLIISPCGPSGRVMKVIAPLNIPDADLDAGLDRLCEAVQATKGAA
ncbi:MAG: diaminobutyrate--2-oxoglutarate transaminase [Myxococcales bacterium]|nr:diaminobutyrate--2-oxoglutarate transaminase [Myxococcales bacterium]